jgi:hypothetical protein
LVTERTRDALNLSGLKPENMCLMFRKAVRISLSVHQTDRHTESTGKSLGNEKGENAVDFAPFRALPRNLAETIT